MMKKNYIFLCFCLLLCSLASYANPGDTTIVTAQDNTQLSWYDNYDTAVTFPDGSVSYRKILMEFQLGKYDCGGNYDPANAGEISDGGTGWCADWDYDVHVIACTPGGDTLEMGELITPYANSTFPNLPWTWKHSYWYDVTDFYPVLKNDVTIRVFYSGYSGGFTATVKFHFIEGTPPRNVVGISKLWHGGFSYGNADDPIENHVAQKAETMPADATAAAAKVIISGHGGDNTENCSEFCKKWYQFKVNGTMVHQQDIWRDNCASNFLYPQSGTWIFDRGNWCPGDQVQTNIEQVPATVSPGQSYNVDIDFQPYTSSGGASYKLSAIMFYYGDFNKNTDASLDAIISPSDNDAYYRENPICGRPRVKVTNTGATPITTIKFSYGITGQSPVEYTWSGNLAPLEATEISLDAEIPALSSVTGTNQFSVKITEVNGSADEDVWNDELKTNFTAAPKWSGGEFIIKLKTTNNVGPNVNKAHWKISDMQGNILFSRDGLQGNTTYVDTVALADGCYVLEATSDYVIFNSAGDSARLGLSFFGSFSSNGFLRINNMADGSQFPLPKYDLGSPGLAGNFGSGLKQFFTVVNSTDIAAITNQYSLSIYPNPANDEINVDVLGNPKGDVKVDLVNIIGQVVYSTIMKDKHLKLPTTGYAQGIYTIICSSGDSRKVEKIVIAH